jgi:hypothetical protein
MYCVMQKGMRQRSQPKKGKDLLAAMLFFTVFLLWRGTSRISECKHDNITVNCKSLPLFLLSIDKNYNRFFCP